jgi:hypothetical protein
VRRTGALTAVLSAALLTGGCVVPAWNDAAYRDDALKAAQSASGETETARITVRGWLDGRVQDPYADVVVTDAESAMDPIQASFGGVDPPSPSANQLRDTITQALGDAQDAVAAARIALRRGDRAKVAKAASDLEKVGTRLQRLTEQLQ